MNRTLFDRPPGAELTGNDLRRRLPTGEATRVRRRLVMLAAAFAVGFAGLSLRVVQLASPALGPGMAAEAAPVAQVLEQPVDWQRRAPIVDRDGRLLAADLPTRALLIHTRRVRDPEDLARQLAAALGDADAEDVLKRMQQAETSLLLRRRLTPDQIAAVHAVGEPAIELLPTVTRSYPAGRLTAHVVGFTDADGVGRSGLERAFDEQLQDTWNGTVSTSIDLAVQHVVHSELAASIRNFSAIGGAAVVLDVHSGEVVSLVSMPDFDANLRQPVRPDAFFNRATYGRYEMGSTFKIFTTAMAMEVGNMRLIDGYDATHPIRFGRFTINDYHAKKRWMTVAEIFKYSSNIGAAKMALDVGPEGQQRFLGSLGLLDPVKLELPEVIAPQAPERWRELETMTIAFGHGLSVSPMQVAAAVAAMVNGGRYIDPTVIERSTSNPATVREVMSEKTSANIRKLLRLVVSSGTGNNADAPGYVVGGKTGTAEKAIARGYSRKRMITSFVGAFPMHAPRYVVLVMLDEPQATKETFGYATAGWNAAPTVARIVPRIAPLLDVAPVDEKSPAVIDALALPPAAEKREAQNATL